METRKISPWIPTAKEATATAAGPAMNFITIPNTVKRIPHAINFSCNAINNPVNTTFKSHKDNI